MAISFDMPYFAEQPPRKWVEQDDNTAFVRIDLSAVQEISLQSGLFDFRANIEIYKDEAELIIVKITGTVNTLIRAEVGFIQSVSSYLN